MKFDILLFKNPPPLSILTNIRVFTVHCYF